MAYRIWRADGWYNAMVLDSRDRVVYLSRFAYYPEAAEAVSANYPQAVHISERPEVN